MSKNKLISLLSPTLFLIFGIWVRFSATSMTKRDAMMPILVSYVIIVISVLDFINEYKKEEHKDRFAGVNFTRLLTCIAAMYLYVFLLPKIGFFVATLLLTGATMWLLDYRNYKILIVSSLVITLAVFGVFYYLLQVPLPTLFL